MSKNKNLGESQGVPKESVELDGKIITAAKSTMIAESYEKGYPLPSGALHMDQ
jgi:hypothetical protein